MKFNKKNLKKMVVFSIMTIICITTVYYIFAPSEINMESVINGNIPQPNNANLINDKKKIYELDDIARLKVEKKKGIQELSTSFDHLIGDVETQENSSNENEKIIHSARAYNEINTRIRDLSKTSKNTDYEKDKLIKKVEELSDKLQQQHALNPTNQMDEDDKKLAFMEKSYQLAAKYFPSITGSVNSVPTQTDIVSNTGKVTQEKKHKILSVNEEEESNLISCLSPPKSVEEIMDSYGGDRQFFFNTMDKSYFAQEKNTIRACIHTTQKVMDGQNVRLRLLEKISINENIIPVNTLLTGVVKINGDRVGIFVSSLEYNGTIESVELSVYDLDGQQGLFVPHLITLNAANEILAGMSNTAGTEVSVIKSTEQQLASSMSNGVIQGISQYFSKKLTTKKITLKSGHQVLLVSK